jgi:hypothetical protein
MHQSHIETSTAAWGRCDPNHEAVPEPANRPAPRTAVGVDDARDRHWLTATHHREESM